GFFGPRGAELAGRLGMGLLTLRRDLLAPYRRGLAGAGRPAGDTPVGRGLNIVLPHHPHPTGAPLAPPVAGPAEFYQPHTAPRRHGRRPSAPAAGRRGAAPTQPVRAASHRGRDAGRRL